MLSKAVQQMHSAKSSYIMIVENEQAIGIITESDIVGLFSESFEGVCWKELTVDHVMTSPIISASSDLNIMEALVIAQGGRIRHIPVIDENGILKGVANQTEIIQSLVEFCRRGDLW